MRKGLHRSQQLSTEDRAAWHVVDDFAADAAITSAELDVVEAFLLPLVTAIMSDPHIGGRTAETPVNSAELSGKDSKLPQSSARFLQG
jgi:hypothetical protein